MFGLQHPLTCKPWTTLSNPCNKARGKYICKEVYLLHSFLCLHSCVLHSCIIYHRAPVSIIESLWYSKWVYNIMRFGACASRVLQGFKTNLVTVNDSFKHHNTTSTKGTKKNAGIERSKKKNKNKQATIGGTDRRGKNRKKTRKQAGR